MMRFAILVPTAGAALALGLLLSSSPAHAVPAPPAVAQVARAALPAVVDIESIDPSKGKGDKSGEMPPPDQGAAAPSKSEPADTSTLIVPPKAEQALGTGFFISPTGYIVTNHHVIAGASEIKVTMHDGSIFTAKLVGSDKKADLAVLKIDAHHPVPFLHFGDSSQLVLGDWVVAIGNPFGLGFSVSAGVVSALHRDIGSGPYDDFIQTDAAINRGNSGGPLLDAKGEVIGVDSAIYSPSGGSVGIGFAIPSSMVRPVAAAIIADGAMKRGWAGLRIEHVSEDMKAAWHLASTDGVVVGGVVADGPSAGKLGPGDVVTAVNGRKVATVHDFKVALAEIPVGHEARMTYERGGRTEEAAITIEPAPAAKGKTGKPAAKPALVPTEIPALGIGVAAHPGGAGVIVITVAKDGPAARAGLLPDTLIEAVGPHFVTTAAALQDGVKASRHVVPLLVGGPAGTSWIVVPLGDGAG
ncbi:trypsin-like peptidase domain-containing protein [Acidiphilium multivorum]|uniref:trypsin-like peptidase domain-containing protein n=2 Tax=Acidiphilium TaxID=522 RepID=UPI001B8CF98D|nr:trypsin-like peptidase domain-containing protein [Acidiphilium multivorum]MBS3022468.1 trypsin-like peptidase domain-containing protein [Acidiphilium multivorum]